MEATSLGSGGGSGVGQSEVIGVIIILGITFTGISIILLSGNPVLDDTKDLARTSTAENGLSLLDERVSSAALSRADKKQLTLNLQSGEMNISSDKGSIRIYSAPPALVWSRSPGATDATHVFNFTVEGNSELVGNLTDPHRLEEITIRYPAGAGFDFSGSSIEETGILTGTDGTIDRDPGVDSFSDFSNGVNIEFNTNSDGVLNETNRITVRYDDVQQPSEGEYDLRVTVENDEGDTVTKKVTMLIGDDIEPPVKQINEKIEMGRIKYETADTVVAYQNGGVWTMPKGEDRISRTVSKPEVYYGENTLTASVINITNDGDISLGGSPSLTVTNTENVRVFPERGTQKTNPLQDRNVYVLVNTSYYNAWSQYFESETVGDVVEVRGTGETRTVAVELSPLPDVVYNNALVTREGDLTLINSTIDAYDSAVSDYSPRFRLGNAKVAAGGNISLRNVSGTDVQLSRVYGDALSERRVVMQNRTFVDGDLKAYGHPGVSKNISMKMDSGLECPVGGDIVAPGVIASPNSCDGNETEKPTERIESLPALVTGTDAEVLVDDEVNDRIDEYSGGLPSSTVSAGNYLIDGTDRTVNNNITFDTTGGPINIAINHTDNSRLIFDGVDINIIGPNPVRVYAGNSSTAITNINEKLLFENADMNIERSGSRGFSVLFHTVSDPDETVMQISDDSEFYGRVYGPDILMQVNDSEVHGAIFAGEAAVDNSGVHYDQQLRNPKAEGVSAVNYLHVTDNRVRVR